MLPRFVSPMLELLADVDFQTGIRLTPGELCIAASACATMGCSCHAVTLFSQPFNVKHAPARRFRISPLDACTMTQHQYWSILASRRWQSTKETQEWQISTPEETEDKTDASQPLLLNELPAWMIMNESSLAQETKEQRRTRKTGRTRRPTRTRTTTRHRRLRPQGPPSARLLLLQDQDRVIMLCRRQHHQTAVVPQHAPPAPELMQAATSTTLWF